MVKLDKKTIRMLMIKQRSNLSLEKVQEKSQLMVSKIRQMDIYQTANIVAIYHPVANEVDLLDLLKDDKTFAFPKVVDNRLDFLLIDNKTKFEKSSFGILEPIDGLLVNDKIDLLLVPSLAINHDFYRVGFGKGYYDRFLSNFTPKNVYATIYDFQLLDFFNEDHDVALNGAIVV